MYVGADTQKLADYMYVCHHFIIYLAEQIFTVPFACTTAFQSNHAPLLYGTMPSDTSTTSSI